MEPTESSSAVAEERPVSEGSDCQAAADESCSYSPRAAVPEDRPISEGSDCQGAANESCSYSPRVAAPEERPVSEGSDCQAAANESSCYSPRGAAPEEMPSARSHIPLREELQDRSLETSRVPTPEIAEELVNHEDVDMAAPSMPESPVAAPGDLPGEQAGARSGDLAAAAPEEQSVAEESDCPAVRSDGGFYVAPVDADLPEEDLSAEIVATSSRSVAVSPPRSRRGSVGLSTDITAAAAVAHDAPDDRPISEGSECRAAADESCSYSPRGAVQEDVVDEASLAAELPNDDEEVVSESGFVVMESKAAAAASDARHSPSPPRPVDPVAELLAEVSMELSQGLAAGSAPADAGAPDTAEPAVSIKRSPPGEDMAAQPSTTDSDGGDDYEEDFDQYDDDDFCSQPSDEEPSGMKDTVGTVDEDSALEAESA
eukprot:gnl/TRDRNA2_/TRDRNA2_128887_c1_seq1.p1 gnl/TRDRNA2_/TRDRNA2_128887_c1~~gnl/TRDRNA2_/TRDRNA2_128887_c1_seq1.p1  ORF type:complete len:488 (-),score=86.13 gnl/TRDRNA2_/TRDRNA2_128887_c1_seq1:59-1348(-)